jgi:hypothetical protein
LKETHDFRVLILRDGVLKQKDITTSGVNFQITFDLFCTMLNDQDSTGKDTDIDDSRHVDKVDNHLDNSSTSIVGLWDIAFIHAFVCKFLVLGDPALHPCPDFQPEVCKRNAVTRMRKMIT